MRIERKSTLTPISGCLSPGLLCVEVVDRKLRDYIALGEAAWSCFHSTHSDSGNITTATTVIPSSRQSISPHVSSITTLSSPHPGNRIVKKLERPYRHGQGIRDSIASRLPARSRATIHRRRHSVIARDLPPRTVNRATYRRNRT